MYIDAFLKYLSNEKRYSEHTTRSYRSDLVQFCEFGNKNIKDFNPLTSDHHIIRKWIVCLMDNGLSSRSVNRKITTLKTYYKFLFREEIIQSIPTQKVALPKMSKQLPHFVSQTAMNNLFDHINFPNSFEGQRDRLIVLMFYCTGMRLSEMVGLKMADIDFHYMHLKVLGKRNKERLIPFGKELLKELNLYIDERSKLNCLHNYLIITKEGKPAYSKLIYRIVNKYLSSATTLEQRSPHVLRHTFATQMLNNGADINAIKELLGHANLSATQIYTHTSFNKLKEIYNQAHPRA